MIKGGLVDAIRAFYGRRTASHWGLFFFLFWKQQRSNGDYSSTTILGFNFSAPFYITPCARAVQAHEGGEINLVKGAAAGDILYIPSGYSSYTFKEIQDAKAKGQVVFQQVGATVRGNTRALAIHESAQAYADIRLDVSYRKLDGRLSVHS